MAGVIYQRTEQGRAKHAARQRAYWARQRAKQLAAPSTPGVCFNAHLRRHKMCIRDSLEGYGRLRRGPIAKDPPLPPARDEQQRRIEQLERENQKLRLRAIKAEALVEFQKKAACLLGAEVTELSDDVC